MEPKFRETPWGLMQVTIIHRDTTGMRYVDERRMWVRESWRFVGVLAFLVTAALVAAAAGA